jgi:cholesterol transport system auxiliary component
MTTMQRNWFLCVAALLLLAGCVNIEKSYPDKRYFVLSAADKIIPANPLDNRNGVLLVSNLRVSPRYEGRSFVYRLTESNFESDFYNQFLVSPGAILTEEVRKAVARAEVFKIVIGGGSQLEPTYVLEGSVNALYGDFRDTGSPKAVLEMEVFLTKGSPVNADVVAQKIYSESIAIAGRSPQALIQGWNRGLEKILTALTADLKSAS